MAKSLKTFHFDAKKSGSILKEWAKSAGMSYQRVADETAYSYDTINNSLSGKIVELSLERVFKIATCTGHSVCEYIRLMLKDEDIDFADRIHVLRDADWPHRHDGHSPTVIRLNDGVHEYVLSDDATVLLHHKGE